MKRGLKFWIEETLLLLAFLVLLCLIAYAPIWGIDQPEDKVEYKYLLCEIKATKKGFDFIPVDNERLSYKDCRKKEKRNKKVICIADVNDKVVIEELK